MPVLNGVTRNGAGNPLAGVSIKVFRSDNDALVASGTSGSDGSYSIVTPGTGPYYAVAYKAGSPDIAGTTVNTLTAEAMFTAAAAVSAGLASVSGAGARVIAGIGGAAGLSAVSGVGEGVANASPVFTSSANQTVAENTPFSLSLTTNIPSTFSVVDGPDAAIFDLIGSSVDAEAFDYENPADVGRNNVYNITVRATSVADPTKYTDQAVTITVTDVVETSDTTPDAFSFTDVTGATVSTVYTSNTITVAGIDAATAISITGGTYSKNGGSYTSSAGTVLVGDTVAVRVTSSGSGTTAVNAVLTIGGVSDTYTVTTAAVVTASAFDPLKKSSDITLSGSNLVATMTGSTWRLVKTLTGHSSGKWYFEFTINDATGGIIGGLSDAGADVTSYLGATANGIGWNGGNIYTSGFSAGVGITASVTTGTVFGIAVDMDAKKAWITTNGTVVSGDPVAGTGAHATWSASYTLFGTVAPGGAGGIVTSTTTYSPPTGYTAWG